MNLQDADLLTAIVTPFNEQNELDFASLAKLTNHLIEQGSNVLSLAVRLVRRQRSAMTKSWHCIVSLLRSLMAVFR